MRSMHVFVVVTGSAFIFQINCPCRSLSWELGMLQLTFFFLHRSVENHIPAATLKHINEE